MKNYWDGVLHSRISRRRSLGLVGSALGTAGALSLVGCGGDDSSGGEGDGGSGTGASGIYQKPVDTSKSAVRGGNFNHRVAGNSLFERYNYDQNVNESGNPGKGGWVYSHLVKSVLGNVDALPDGSVEGDFCESWEMSPDGMKVTFKVRPGMKWDSRTPTNGRTPDSSDVKFSYDRWAAGNPRRSLMANAANPSAPVTTVTAPDSQTVVMNLAFPYAPLMTLLAVNPFPLVYPKEIDQVDARNVPRGSAAWIEDEIQEAVFTRFRRNPDWYIKDRPFLDTYTVNVVPDYANGLAQFKTGSLDTFEVTQEDILPTKKDAPNLVIFQDAKWRNNPGGWMFFGLRPGSPFRDDRVRKALSMSVDRDAYLEVFSNKEKFEAEGLPVDTVWYNFLGAGYPDIWLDPKGSELGQSSKFYKFDVAEAKKMLQAAGHNSPLEFVWNVPDVSHGDTTEAIRGGIAGTGNFKLGTVNVMTYNPDFNRQVRESKGDFDGMAYVGWGANADPDHTLFGLFHPTSAPNWQIGLGEDPALTRQLEAQRSAVTRPERVKILKDLQKYLSENMFAVPAPGDYHLFRMHQPWAMNFDYFVPWIVDPGFANVAQMDFTFHWFDKSKKS